MHNGLDTYGGYDDISFYQSGHLKFLIFFTWAWDNWHREYKCACKKLQLADTNQNEQMVRMEPSTYRNCPNWLDIAVGAGLGHKPCSRQGLTQNLSVLGAPLFSLVYTCKMPEPETAKDGILPCREHDLWTSPTGHRSRPTVQF